MIIKARFASQCSECQGPIAVGQSILWSRTVRGARHADVELCHRLRNALRAEPVVVTVVGIVAFLQRAGEHLKAPKARFLSPTNEELRLSLAKPGSANPGSIYVTEAGRFIGKIAVDGTINGPLASRSELIETLQAIEADPANAARAYGALMGRCSFCGLTLTDAGSVAVGYGPICAGKWHLPWERLGVPELTQIPEAAAAAAEPQGDGVTDVVVH